MRPRVAFLVASLAIVAFIACCGGPVWRLIEGGPAGFHQISVKHELAEWEREYSSVRDWRKAWRAAEMLEYISIYYTPRPGYRGSKRSEAELEAQRAQTLKSIASGLRDFTGQNFEADAAQWKKWLIQEGHVEGK
ncbi:hypothetical protein BH10PLA2_BH10PLA2_39040 [soil metagenome]